MNRGTQGNENRPDNHSSSRESSRSNGRALPNPGKPTIQPVAETLKIMGYYTLFGFLWIFFSDKLLSLFVQNIHLYEQIQLYKGFLYVLLTAVLFFYIILRRMRANRFMLDYAVESTTKADALNEELRQEHELTERLLQESAVIVFILDPLGGLINMNAQAIHLSGYQPEELRGGPVWDKVIPAEELERLAGTIAKAFLVEPVHNLETHLLRKDGGTLSCLWNLNHLNDADGRPFRLIAIGIDITEQKILEHNLQQLAYFDPLTRLPNRTLLMQLADEKVAAAKRDHDCLGVIYFNIDNLGHINGSFGHGTGDTLLQAIGRELAARILVPDIPACIGSNDFVVVLPGLSDETAAMSKAEDILRLLQQPWTIDGRELLLEIGMGIAVYPEHGDSPQELIQNASMAMYTTIVRGSGRIGLFRSGMAIAGRERLSLVNRLRVAIRNKEFTLEYQPQISLYDGRLYGFEALIRWRDCAGNAIPPDIFIPIAEETGQIRDIDHWVFNEACRQKRSWQDAGFGYPVIAVNLSAKVLFQAGLADSFRQSLLAYGIDGSGIEVEITETAYLGDFEQAIQVMGEIRELGISIALDDFGAGYSSLTYLKRLPIDRLKIDRAFLLEIESAEQESYILQAIIDMAHRMGLVIVAEGVETNEQLRFIHKSGCDLAQGFLLARPAPAQVWTALLSHPVVSRVADVLLGTKASE